MATVIYLPLDTESVTNKMKEGFQRRDENDYLYRARHVSEWVSGSVDYDEFFAPTLRLSDANVHKANGGSVFPEPLAQNIDFTNASLASVFYPLHK